MKRRYAVLLLLASLLPGTAQARLVEAEGEAPIVEGAINKARDQAVRHAIERALMQTEALVDTTAAISSNVLIMESSRVNAAGTVKDVAVIDEWVERDTMHVRIRAQVPREALRAPSPAARYRKKIAVLQFAVLDRRLIYDLPDIEREMPRELARRMAVSDQFVSVDGSDFLRQSDTSDDVNSAAYVTIADQLGVQFLVTGTIRDTGVTKKLLSKSRRLEVEIFVYDGLSGTRLGGHRFSENVAQADYFERGGVTLFSNAEFLHTAYGRALDRVLNRQLEMIQTDLAAVPFSARILQIDGKKVYFNAGAASKVQPGDILMTYRLDPQPLYDRVNARFLGYKESPVASLAVHQVQPQFAMGELEVEKADLHAGDIIRFGW